MELALGVFHWSEASFWACSLRAWDRAVAGHMKWNGTEPGGKSASVKRLTDLMEQYP